MIKSIVRHYPVISTVSDCSSFVLMILARSSFNKSILTYISLVIVIICLIMEISVIVSGKRSLLEKFYGKWIRIEIILNILVLVYYVLVYN